MEQIAALKFTVKAGVLARRSFINQLKNTYFFEEGKVEVSWEEDRGWFSSFFRVTVVGPEDKVRLIEQRYQRHQRLTHED